MVLSIYYGVLVHIMERDKMDELEDTKIKMEEFIKKIEQATETVRSWPKWKQNMIGPSLPNVEREKKMKEVTVWYKLGDKTEQVRRVFNKVINVAYPDHGAYIHSSYFDEDGIRCLVTYPTHLLVEVEEEYVGNV